MKLLILAAAIVASGIVAEAAGRQEASKICKSMSFESNRNACVSALSKYEYFDEGAIGVCLGVSFDDDKLQCVTAIANKSYDAYEIENCAKASFADDKVKCLAGAGRHWDYQSPNPPPPIPPQPAPPPGYPGCLNKPELLRKLQNADRLVYDRRNNDARIVLNDLISRLQRCPF